MFSGTYKEVLDRKNNFVAGSRNLENQGQTHFCMTILISGCRHETHLLILMSDSNISEVKDLETTKITYLILRVDFENQGHTFLLPEQELDGECLQGKG